MPEKFNVKIGIPNSGMDAYGRERRPWVKPLRLKDVVAEINANNQLQDWVKKELIQKVSNYPVGALKHFCNNIGTHIESIRRKRIDDENERNEENEEGFVAKKEEISGQKEAGPKMQNT